jgi:hypothetical protein
LLKDAFSAQYSFLQTAAQVKKPAQTDPAYQALLKDTSEALTAAANVTETDKGPRKYINQLKMVAEGAAALGWVTVEPKPAPYVKDTKESAEFYANRIIKEFKERWALLRFLSEIINDKCTVTGRKSSMHEPSTLCWKNCGST